MKKTRRYFLGTLTALLLALCLTAPAQAAWKQDSKGWYYVDGNGQRLTSTWQKDSKGWCYLGADGYMVVNDWVQDSKGWCYIGADGYAVTNCWKKDSTGWCYLDSEGSMTKNAWVCDGGYWYYLDGNGYMVTNSWRKDSTGWCYLDASGKMVTNDWVQDSKGWCYIGADGYCVTNCWKQDSTGWCYLDSEGSMTKSAWVTDGGKQYYCDANGYMVTGWQTIGENKYYFNSNGTLAVSQWIASGKDWYYVDGSGCMVTSSWRKDSKGWCYLDATGKMVTNDWVQDSKGWCYIGTDGYCVTNCWKQDSTGWCYLDSEGSMTKNDWVLDGGKWYYCDGNGYMVTGWRTIGQADYYFYSSGVMAANTTVDGIQIGADGKAEKKPVTEQPDAGYDPDTQPEDNAEVLTIGLPSNSKILDYETNALTQWLEEQTGYKIDFVLYSGGSDAATQIATTIAAGQELPDILYGFNLSESVVSTYGQNGYLLDLSKYYADTDGASANFWTALDSNLTQQQQSYVMRRLVDAQSGEIYAIPYIETTLTGTMNYQAWINTGWLDALDLETPTSMEELYNVLVAFKTQDPNGNGNPNDEIPLFGSEKVSGAQVVDWLLNMFLYYDDNYQWQPDANGQLQPVFTQDAYREALTFINKLYEEELLNPILYTASSNEMKNITTPSSGTAICGIFIGDVTRHTDMSNDLLRDYEPMMTWGYAVEKDVTCKLNTLITADCDTPNAAFQLLMTLWSWEGSMRVRYGQYGVNWTDPDSYSDSVYGLDAEYKLISDPTTLQNTAHWGTVACTLNRYANGATAQDTSGDYSYLHDHINTVVSGSRKLFDWAAKHNNPETVCPYFVLDTEDSAVEAAQLDVKNYVSQSQTQFVLGQMDISSDEIWAAYLAQLEEHGLSSLQSAMQSAYEEAISCPVENHVYSTASCTTASECVYCGKTNGNALGHSYQGESCSRCGSATPSLTEGRWKFDGVSVSEYDGEIHKELERMSLSFGADGTGYLSVGYWGCLTGMSADSQQFYIMTHDDLVEVDGEWYYSMSFGSGGETTYTVSGDTVVISVHSRYDGSKTGAMTLTKTGDDQYTVTAVEDTILDSQITQAMPVGSVFTWSAPVED